MCSSCKAARASAALRTAGDASASWTIICDGPATARGRVGSRLDTLVARCGIREAQSVLQNAASTSAVADPGEAAVRDAVGASSKQRQVVCEDPPHNLGIALATPSPGNAGSANNGLTLTHPLLVPAKLQLVEQNQTVIDQTPVVRCETV